jgi:alcohol dehydrogenase (cytochrome c)
MAKITTTLLAGACATSALMLGLSSASANDSVIKGGQDPNQWAVYGKDYANTRFSPLETINTGNVSHLSLAYSLQLGSLRSNESTPLVIGDTMYVSTSWGPKYVYALDAATGEQKCGGVYSGPECSVEFG